MNNENQWKASHKRGVPGVAFGTLASQEGYEITIQEKGQTPLLFSVEFS